MCSGVGLEGFAHLFGGVECRASVVLSAGHVQHPVFASNTVCASGSSEMAVADFFGLFVSFVQNVN